MSDMEPRQAYWLQGKVSFDGLSDSVMHTMMVSTWYDNALRPLVLLHFGTEVVWAEMLPRQARELARALIEHADAIEAKWQ